MAENRLPSHPANRHIVQPLWNADPIVWHWHCRHTGLIPANTEAMICMGITKKDAIIGSVIYHRFRWPDIEIGIHTTDPGWCTKRILREIFSYPFLRLDCKRVTATTDPSKPEVCKFIERLGFVHEGRLRNALPHGDLLIMGMQRGQCRWIQNNELCNRRVIRRATTAA